PDYMHRNSHTYPARRTSDLMVRRWRAIHECDHFGVTRIKGVSDVHIETDRVRYRTSQRQERSLPADHVILAAGAEGDLTLAKQLDRKSTRLNSSHVKISYAV